jgi:lysophospholipase L1-like esterase
MTELTAVELYEKRQAAIIKDRKARQKRLDKLGAEIEAVNTAPDMAAVQQAMTHLEQKDRNLLCDVLQARMDALAG